MSGRAATRLAVALWVAMTLAVSVRVATSDPAKQSVVPIYRAAGERWAAGESLYAPAPPHDTFRYPPGFAACISSLAIFPETPAAIGWRLFGVAIFLSGLRRFATTFDATKFPILALLALPLVLPSFNNGQVNVAIVGFVMWGVADAVENKPTRAAVWLAVSAGIKIYPLAAGLLAILLCPRALAWRFALIAILAFAFPFAFHNPEYVWRQYGELVDWVGRDDRLHGALERVPRDWTALARFWLGWVPSGELVRGVSAAGSLAFAAVVAISKKRHGAAATAPIVVALGGIWMTLFGPATESATYCLAAPGAAWLVATGPRVARLIALFGYALLVSPVIRDLFSDGWHFGVAGPQALGVAVLIPATLIRAFASGRSVTNPDCGSLRESTSPMPIRVPSPSFGPCGFSGLAR